MSNRIAKTVLTLAQQHVENGRHIVAGQEARVARLKADGGDSTLSEDVLDSFRQTQAIFEADLARLMATAE